MYKSALGHRITIAIPDQCSASAHDVFEAMQALSNHEVASHELDHGTGLKLLEQALNHPTWRFRIAVNRGPEWTTVALSARAAFRWPTTTAHADALDEMLHAKPTRPKPARYHNARKRAAIATSIALLRPAALALAERQLKAELAADFYAPTRPSQPWRRQ